jgi:hypothetical protein
MSKSDIHKPTMETSLARVVSLDGRPVALSHNALDGVKRERKEGREMRIGDVSRRRRLSDPARMRWYAHHRSVRFSRRMLQGLVTVVVRPVWTPAGCVAQ